jgi:hypothetical protein
MVVSGIMAAYIVNWAPKDAPDNWRWMLGLGALPGLALAIGMYFQPFSPAHALIGRAIPIGQSRGQPLEGALFSPVLVTAHPSSVLRERERESRHEALAAIVSDLRVAAGIAAEDGPASRPRA